MIAELSDIFNANQEGKNSLILAGMIADGEDELICDLAETYRILHYRTIALPLWPPWQRACVKIPASARSSPA